LKDSYLLHTSIAHNSCLLLKGSTDQLDQSLLLIPDVTFSCEDEIFHSTRFRPYYIYKSHLGTERSTDKHRKMGKVYSLWRSIAFQ